MIYLKLHEFLKPKRNLILMGINPMNSSEIKPAESSEETERIKSESNDDSEKIDGNININRLGFVFMFLFISILGYLVIGSFVGIPPFAIDNLTLELIITSDELLTVLIVLDLVALLLGIYFGWIKKPKVEQKTEEQSDELVFTDEEIEELNNVENDEE